MTDGTGSGPGHLARRLVPTVATVLAIALFVTAGNWQRGRMEQKEALGAALDAARQSPPIPLPADVGDGARYRFRPVMLEGTYDAGRQILIDNRVHEGRAGYHVVTPLRLTDGRAILVVRGWIAAPATRREVPLAPTPAGNVVVRGRIDIAPTRYLELHASPPVGPVWQNLDPKRFRAATGLDVVDAIVEQSQDGAPPDGLVRDWPSPDLGVEKHRIYMVQWYLFAALAAALWLWFHRRRGAPPSP